MGSVVSGLLSTTVATTGEAEKVSLGDIEGQLRGVAGKAQVAIAESKANLIASGVVGGVLVVAAAYLHGRRRGRRRASVLEIRRI
jgi:hypothetical protein